MVSGDKETSPGRTQYFLLVSETFFPSLKDIQHAQCHFRFGLDALNQIVGTLRQEDEAVAAIFPHEVKVVFTLGHFSLRDQRREVMLNSREQIIDSYLIAKHTMVVAGLGGGY